VTTLHGFSSSNYYNIVKHVLMYKGIPFEEDLDYGASEDFLTLSPMGKIPALTTEQGGHLSESSVCCDYLEETWPDQPLYPADSFSRNYVRQIMKVSELYLELPCRRLIPYIFTDTAAPEELLTEIRSAVERGLAAITRLCEFEPYLAGSEMTMADIYLRYVLKVVAMAGTSRLEWDIIGAVPGLADWNEMMADSDIARKIDADQAENLPDFMAYLQQRFNS
jgi:glutathione S-transferase